MATAKKILITGASGFIGQALCEALAKRGDFVIAVTRSPERQKSSIPCASKVISWDQISGEKEIHAVIHLAGESVAQRWTQKSKERILNSRVKGLQQLRQALNREPGFSPAVLISASGIGYYGNRADDWLSEDSPPGTDFLASTCIAWEREALAIQASRQIIFRIGMVLGKDGGALAKMLPPFRLGLGGRLGKGNQWISWIQLDDLVSLFLFAIDQSSLSGTFNAVSPNPVTNEQFTKNLAKVLNRPAPFPVPSIALKMALGEMAEMLLGGQRGSAKKLEQAGFHFSHPQIFGALKASVG